MRLLVEQLRQVGHEPRRTVVRDDMGEHDLFKQQVIRWWQHDHPETRPGA